MKSRLIVNPISGSDSAPNLLGTINERLRRDFGAIDIALTIAAGDARELAAKSVLDGYTNIFVAGGDGTLNEVINGAASIANGLEQVTFGLIPLGTGNDFANTLGLIENIEETFKVLAQRHIIPVDVGKLDERFFINVSAGGFIAEVSANTSETLKNIAGKLAYLIGGVQVFFDFEPVGMKMRLETAAEVVARDYPIQMFAVCNARRIGGGNIIAPKAIIDDGLLDVYLFRQMTALEFVGVLNSIRTADHLDSENVELFLAKAVDFEFARPIKTNVDGEVFTVRTCSYRILPRAAKFLANPGN